MPASLHQHTPTLTVIDPRGLSLRTVAYLRQNPADSITERNHRQVFNASGQLIQQWDPRLFELSERESGVQPNQATLYSLTGQALYTQSVDAGWRAVCHDAAGLLREVWDSRETHHRYDYDARMRPVRVLTSEHCVERFTYAGSSTENARNNRGGQMVRHDDPAGSLWHETFGLSGQPLTETRRFCASLTPPAWPESEADLEPRAYTTQWWHDAVGTVIEHMDALDHVQRFEMNVAGQPCLSFLDGVALLKSAHYNASGQVEVEHTGNEMITTAQYSPIDGLLYSLKAEIPGAKALQDMHYHYDPVGNIERIEDLAQPVQWFAQQRIQAVSTYTYDSLYQLTSATGRENTLQTIGPGLPGLAIFGAKDDSRWRNYTQIYAYDSGGNLTRLKHDAGAGNSCTREMAVDTRSNRSLFKDGSPIDFAKGFDTNGNQQQLIAGQVMQWDMRNQLHQVTQVLRDEPDGQDGDFETYVYDSGGQRVRKVRRAKTRSGEHLNEVRYLPGLEIRTRTLGEQLHVVIAQAGNNTVRLLHWASGQPKSIANNQWRYSLSDHLGSSTLELDQHGEVISQESYYPYGGTAWWAAKNVIDAQYKAIRYSGKERDAAGLYYYGFRYYAPWLQRWINPDPAGDVDGLNVFRMVRNNPVVLKDVDGRMPFGNIPKRINNGLTVSNAREEEPSHARVNALDPSISDNPKNNSPSSTAAHGENPIAFDTAGPVKRRYGRSHSVHDLTTAYRYDTRSPVEIMNRGFEGTDSDDHLFARYGRNNVFTSTLREGADMFRKSAEVATHRKDTLHLYKLSLRDMTYFDFYREHTIKGDKSIREIAHLKFKQNHSSYTATKKYKAIGQEGFEHYLFQKMYGPIVEAFVVVNELHIQGPVPPQNITPLLPETLAYLDLAISHSAGRGRTRSGPARLRPR